MMHKRKVGKVFQKYTLWPHMTIFQIVAYCLENIGIPKSKIGSLIGYILKKSPTLKIFKS